MRTKMLTHVMKAFRVSTCLTLLAGSVAFAGTGSSGGGGKYSKLCAYKTMTVLEMVGDSTAFSKDELRQTFMNNVKWIVTPRLIDNETRKIVAERIAKNGEKFSDPTTAFYGSPGLIQVNSVANLEDYCHPDKHENDEVILHELLRAARYNDEVFQISLVALRNKNKSNNTVQAPQSNVTVLSKICRCIDNPIRDKDFVLHNGVYHEFFDYHLVQTLVLSDGSTRDIFLSKHHRRAYDKNFYSCDEEIAANPSCR